MWVLTNPVLVRSVRVLCVPCACEVGRLIVLFRYRADAILHWTLSIARFVLFILLEIDGKFVKCFPLLSA